MIKLLSSLSMKVHKGIDKVRDACTNVEEVDELVIKVKVKSIRHIL